MFSYLLHFIHAFLPAALITGLIVAWWTPLRAHAARSLVIALAAGFVGGLAVYLISFGQETVTAARSFLCAAGIVAALFHAAGLMLSAKRGRAIAAVAWWGALLLVSLIAAATICSFLALVAEQALSAISVLNTELLLNIGGILSGAMLMGYFIPMSAHLGGKIGRGRLSVLLLLACALLVVPWSAEIMLGLMRLELIELTSGRLSFVAKIGKYSYLFPYLQLIVVVFLALLSRGGQTAPTPDAPSEPKKAAIRKARSRAIFELRWFKSALAAVGLIAAVLLYNDLYASRPPKISPAVRLTPDAGGLIKLKIDRIGDGKLHRFSYLTDDGHVVRFFLINRLNGGAGAQKKIGVVYDACMLCGDKGYLQEKNEIICIACNVRIFVPSIGKEGGCNPIPLKHEVQGEYIVISAQELDKGARYFSEVAPVKVKDPVTGKEQSSLNAPYRYEYNGRIYFFESGESEEKFRSSPEKYGGDRPGRYLRVQGYQAS